MAQYVWHSAPVTTAACTWLTTASAPRIVLPSGEREDVCVCVSGRACVCVCLKGNYLKTWPPPTNRIDMHHFAVRAHRRQTDLEGSSDTSTI